MTANDRGLAVLLEAGEPARHARLARVLASLGHRVVPVEHEAAVALIDLPGEEWPPPDQPGLPSLVLSDKAEIANAASVRAVLPRGVDPLRLDAALRAAAAGLFVRADPPGAAPPGFAALEDEGPLLSPRELEVLQCIGDGLSNKAIARHLGISAHTVKFHVEAVFAKLGARSRADAVGKGLRRRILEI